MRTISIVGKKISSETGKIHGALSPFILALQAPQLARTTPPAQPSLSPSLPFSAAAFQVPAPKHPCNHYNPAAAFGARGQGGRRSGWRPLQAAAESEPRQCQCHGVGGRRARKAARSLAPSPRPGRRMQPSPWSGGGGSRSCRGRPGSGCCSLGTGCSPSSPPSCSTPWRR